MANERDDSEFVEIHVDTPAATGEVTPDNTPEAPADAEAAPKPVAEEPDGEKAEDEGKKDDDAPLRDERGRYKGGVQGRIDTLTRLRHDAERRAEAAEAEVARMRAPAGQDGAKPGPAAAPKPAEADFENYGDYVEALTDWKADQRDASRASDAATRAHGDAAEARSAIWQAKIANTAAALPDYSEVVDKSEIPIANHVAAAIMDAEQGPELAYFLAKNPDVADKLNEMSPMRAAVELGKIEATLAKPAEPPKLRETRQTQAPAPINPVQAGSTTSKNPSDMSMEEYAEFRKKAGLR